MEDSTGMTIEFLRARLLAERSVSRIATQRADDLANRVLELEEQLKIVSLQRKKAEKTTANVLSILENHGIEFSEEIDSTSDQEVTYSESKVGDSLPKEEESSAGSKMMRNHMDVVSVSELESSPLPSRSHGIKFSEEIGSTSDQEVTYSESKVGNGLPKEEESSADSKMMRNHMDVISVSELGSSPLPSQSLSWKSGKDSSRSLEKKYVDSSTRRRSNFASSTSASLERLVGKSCRRIQRRETRSADEESQIDNRTLACQHNRVDTCSEVSSTCYGVGPEVLRGNCEKQDARILDDGPLSGDFEDQRPKSNDSIIVGTRGSDKNMERTLEYQAELIGQYEEEEKAQREWEEKFKDDNYTVARSWTI